MKIIESHIVDLGSEGLGVIHKTQCGKYFTEKPNDAGCFGILTFPMFIEESKAKSLIETKIRDKFLQEE